VSCPHKPETPKWLAQIIQAVQPGRRSPDRIPKGVNQTLSSFSTGRNDHRFAKDAQQCHRTTSPLYFPICGAASTKNQRPDTKVRKPGRPSIICLKSARLAILIRPYHPCQFEHIMGIQYVLSAGAIRSYRQCQLDAIDRVGAVLSSLTVQFYHQRQLRYIVSLMRRS
jgi:hypothetical protein